VLLSERPRRRKQSERALVEADENYLLWEREDRKKRRSPIEREFWGEYREK